MRAALTRDLNSASGKACGVRGAVYPQRYFCATAWSILTLSGHSDRVNHAAWSHDETRILTASGDHSAKVWDAQSGVKTIREPPLLTLSGHQSSVNYAAWSGDDKRIVTASADGTARIYFTDIEDLLEFACQRSSRNMTRSEWERYIGRDVPYQRTCPKLPIPPG